MQGKLDDYFPASKTRKTKRQSESPVKSMAENDPPMKTDEPHGSKDDAGNVAVSTMDSDPPVAAACEEAEKRADPDETMSLDEQCDESLENLFDEDQNFSIEDPGSVESTTGNSAKETEQMETESNGTSSSNAAEDESLPPEIYNSKNMYDDSPAQSDPGGKSARKNKKKGKKVIPDDVETEPEIDFVEEDVSVVHISQEVTPMIPARGVHAFLVDYNVLTQNKVISYPEQYADKWQPGHVMLPCSHKCMLRESRCTNTNSSNRNKWKKPKERQTTQIQETKYSAISHWEVVVTQLSGQLPTIDDLVTAMDCYNPGIIELCGPSFRTFFNTSLTHIQRAHFFSILLPKLQQLALQLPALVTQEIPLLAQNSNMSVTLSKKQIACILANMFFNTFQTQDKSLPRNSNFFTLFCSKAPDRQKSNYQKVKCLINYFNRLLAQDDEDFNDLQGVISFHRRCLDEDERPKWESLDLPLTSCLVKADGLIENMDGTLQVDFANKFVGGGVLGDGCVQEEIRFATHPELYVSMLFTPCLLDNECLIVQGAERYCNHSGYARSFKFTGDHLDTNPTDLIGRKLVTVVAIDATPYRSQLQKDEQYQVARLLRELNKAYIGFKPALKPSKPEDRPTAVATGNWGCGAFGGNTTLKFIIQWLAATYARRDLVYFTFHDKKLASDLTKVRNAFLKKPYTIKEVWKLLCRYNKSDRTQTLLDFMVA